MAIVIRSGGGLERGLVRRRRCREGRGLDSREASEPWLKPGKAAPRGRAYARASPARWWLACTPCMMPEHLPRLSLDSDMGLRNFSLAKVLW
jgi:hypothetical protein